MKTSKLFRKGMFALLLLLSIFGFACAKPVELTIEGNTDLSIVQGASDVNLLEGITVKANGEAVALGGDVTLIVSNNGGFDVNKVGEYTITLTASHVKGAVASATRKVTVLSSDKVPPILDVTPKTITHFQGENIDLLMGVKVVDNVDLDTLKATVKDNGGYDKEVPGTYTITYSAKDSAGNESTATRTIEVVESYTRATFDNETYFKAVYNPQVGAAYTGSNYLNSYDTTVVNVLSTDYVRYLLANAPERLGGNTGWSIVVLTDASNKVVYMRHFQTGEAALKSAYPNYNFDQYVKEDLSNTYKTNTGEDLISFNSNEWCTGTTTAANKAYGSAAKGLMMANIEQWLIDGGNVFLFLNSAVDNQAARSFAVKNTMDDFVLDAEGNATPQRTYGLGRTLTVDGLDRQTTTQYDKSVGFPIIEVPGSWTVNKTSGIHSLNTKIDYYKGTELDLLAGVTASHNGNDITSDITVKVYNYVAGSTTPEGYLGTESTVDAIKEASDGAIFLAVYEVVSGEYFDRVAVLVQVYGQTPDQLEVHEGETLFGILMGQKYKLLLNNIAAFTELANVTDAGLVFTADVWATLENPRVEKGVVVLLDEYYNVVQVNVENGARFTIWGNGELVADSFGEGELSANLDVPSRGFVLVYPEGANGATLKYALNALYDSSYESGALEADKLEVKVPYGMELEVEYRNVSSVDSLLVNGTAIPLKYNDATALANPTNSGANIRLDSHAGYIYVYDKATLAATLESVASQYATNAGVPYFPQGIAIILTSEYKLHQVRMSSGGDASQIQINADGTVSSVADSLKWNALTTPLDANNAHGLMKDIVSDVPEGGYVAVIANFSQTQYPGQILVQKLYDSAYATGAIEFAKFAYTQEDILAWTFERKMINTDVTAAPRLARPEVASDGRTLTWNAVANAAKYVVYVDGSQYKTVTENTYLLPASLVAGTHTVQVRAVVADDSADHTNSVLSDALELLVDETNMLTKPVASVNEEKLTWAAVEGAVSYKVMSGEDLLGTTEETEFDLSELMTGVYNLQVQAITSNEELVKYNSELSEIIEYEVEAKVTPVTVRFAGMVANVKYNDASLLMNPTGSGANIRLQDSHAALYTKNAYLSALQAAADSGKYDNIKDKTPYIAQGTVVLLNADGSIYKSRAAIAGTPCEIAADGTVTTVTTGWAVAAPANGGILNGLETEIPEGGYVLIFAAGGANVMRKLGVNMFADSTYASGAWTSNTDIDRAKLYASNKVQLLTDADVAPAYVSFAGVGAAVRYNDANLLMNPTGNGANIRLQDSHAALYTKEVYLSALQAAADSGKYDSVKDKTPYLPQGTVVLLNADGSIYKSRAAIAGTPCEIAADGTVTTVTTGWAVAAPANGGILNGLETEIPEGGYVLIFAAGGANVMRKLGVNMFADSTYASGAWTSNTDIDRAKLYASNKVLKVMACDYLINKVTFAEQEAAVRYNDANLLMNPTGNGANIRLQDSHAALYTKDVYLSALQAAADSGKYDNVKDKTPYLPQGTVVLLNADGSIYKSRAAIAGTPCEIAADGTVTTVTTGWAVAAPANGGILNGLETEIPEGGYVLIFAAGGANVMRKLGVNMFADSTYASGAWTSNTDIDRAKLYASNKVQFAYDSSILVSF